MITFDEMVDVSRQQRLLVTNKNIKHLLMKLLMFLSDNGFKILHDHEKLTGHDKIFTGNSHDKDDSHGESPISFSWFVRSKDINILQIAAAYVEERDKLSKTPLHCSTLIGDIELVDIFLKAGADVNVKDGLNLTPLHFSAGHGFTEIVDILLKTGADVDAVDNEMRTPLHLSVKFKHDDIAKLLLQAGASVDLRDKRGLSVLDYMDNEERVRLGFKPVSTFDRLFNFAHTRTCNVKCAANAESNRTEFEREETISATFTKIHKQCVQFETSHSKKVSCSARVSSCDSSPPLKQRYVNDVDSEEINNIAQQLYERLSTYTPHYKEGWDTSFTHGVKAASQSGQIVLNATINIIFKKIYESKKIYRKKKIYNNKIVKNTYKNGGKSKISIVQPSVVSLHGHTVVKCGRDKNDDSDEESEYGGSSSDESSDRNKFKDR